MLDTPYNRNIKSKVSRNMHRYINHENLKDGSHGLHIHDRMLCANCGSPNLINNDSLKGGKVNWKSVGNEFKSAGKNIAKKSIEMGGTALGGLAGATLATATGNPEMIPAATSLGGYAGNQLGKAAGNAILGAGMKRRGRPRKGAASKTHPHELDYTTKKGDIDHHIGGHDIFEALMPYEHRKKHIIGGSNIAARSISESITGGKMKKINQQKLHRGYLT